MNKSIKMDKPQDHGYPVKFRQNEWSGILYYGHSSAKNIKPKWTVLKQLSMIIDQNIQWL